MVGSPRAPAVRLALVHEHRIEVGELGAQERELPSLPARHEYQPAGLVLDQPLQEPALLGRELVVLEAHVAQKNDVELRELVTTGGELFDVVLVAAAHLAQSGMKEQARKLDAGIARERIAQIAVLPARQ